MTTSWRLPSKLLVAALLSAAVAGQSWVQQSIGLHLGGPVFREGGVAGGPVTFLAPDVWEWDGADWEVSSALPAGTYLANFAFDAARNEQVAIGSPDGIATTTYVRRGGAWLARGAAPAILRDVLAFHPGRGGVIAIGSPDQLWNGTAWTPLPAVPARDAILAAAHDPSRGVLVALGVNASGNATVWESGSSGTWQLVPTGNSPALLSSPLLAWDPITAQMVLFLLQASGSASAATWSWNGSAWTQRNTTTVPDGPQFPRLALDPVRGRLRLFGSETRNWEWTGSDWLEYSPYGSSMSASQVWNSLLRRLSRYDSEASYDWDGRTWTRTPMVTPPIGDEPAAFDVMTFSTVLLRRRPFGSTSSETWLQAPGGPWQLVATAAAPPARSMHALLSAPLSGGVVLFGGFDASIVPLADTWWWNGAWTELTNSLALSPPPGQCVSGSAMQVGTPPMLASGSQLWRWTNQWQLVDAGAPLVLPLALTVRSDGTPVIAGYDGTRNLIVDLRGGQWRVLSTGAPFVDALLEDPLRGTLLAYYHGEVAAFTATPAGEAAIGPGCGLPEPRIVGRGLSQWDNPSFAIALRGAPSVPAALVFAASAGNQVLGSGCTLWLGAASEFRFAVTDAEGAVDFALPIPAVPALRGLAAFVQGGTLQSSAPLGIALSGGLRISVGD